MSEYSSEYIGGEEAPVGVILEGDDRDRRDKDLADRIGRLFGMAVEAAVSHTKSHCCPPGPDGQAAKPGGEREGVRPDPPEQAEITEFGGQARMRCAPASTDAIGAVNLVYEAPQPGLVLKTEGTHHVPAGENASSTVQATIAKPPDSYVGGPNEITMSITTTGGQLRYGLYLGHVQASEPGPNGLPVGPVRPIVIYVTGVG